MFYHFVKLYNQINNQKEIKNTNVKTLSIIINGEIRNVVLDDFKKEKITYKYRAIDLDKNILLKYIYHLSNLPNEKIEEIFPSIEIQKGNLILDVKAREIQNSIERALIDYKTVGTRELLIYSILNVICVCSDLINEKMNIDNIFLFIGTEKYCIRKYLCMLLTNFYRRAEKKRSQSKEANIDFEIRWFKMTLKFLKQKSIRLMQQYHYSLF